MHQWFSFHYTTELVFWYCSYIVVKAMEVGNEIE